MNPERQLGDEKFVAKEVTDPDDYVRLYTLAEDVYAEYRDYRVKTATYRTADSTLSAHTTLEEVTGLR